MEWLEKSSGEVALDLRPGGQGGSKGDEPGKNILSRENSTCKGLRARAVLGKEAGLFGRQKRGQLGSE